MVVTLGQHGCCARADGAFSCQTAFEVTPIDSTGAGDTFCGVLVAALSQGHNLEQALRLASAAGALACTRLGATPMLFADLHCFQTLGLSDRPALLIGADLLGRFREVTLDFPADTVTFSGLRRQPTRTLELPGA